MKMIKNFSLLVALISITCIFSACDSNKGTKIINIIQNAETVYINDTERDTVEAYMGAFEGGQGDYIEFKFTEPQTFNTVFITEKTATIRQFNIYAETHGEYKLIHTGKHILQENISVEETTATAIKIEVINTQIGNDHFIIQGVSAYNMPKGE